MSGAEWMKGICHIWSRGRHFSPSLPGNRYLKLSPQKRPPGRNLGEHHSVRRSGTASRGTALLVLGKRMRSVPRTALLPYSWVEHVLTVLLYIPLLKGISFLRGWGFSVCRFELVSLSRSFRLFSLPLLEFHLVVKVTPSWVKWILDTIEEISWSELLHSVDRTF